MISLKEHLFNHHVKSIESSSYEHIMQQLNNIKDWPSDYREQIKQLNAYAKENGFEKIIYKQQYDKEFTIFLYNKHIKAKGYCVGYDGTWSRNYPELSFKRCLSDAYAYIHKYSKK